MDEIYLSSSFMHMNLKELLTTRLDYDQKAPVGFLILVKFMINAFGKSELSLRMLPLFAGIVSIFIYHNVTKHFLKDLGQIIALSIFSFAPAIIYHSVEVKQYSCECLMTIIALNLYIKYRNNSKWKYNILWGVYGSIIIWFSYSVVFILAGMALGIMLDHIINNKWNKVSFHILPFLMWMLSFLANFNFFTHRNTSSEWVTYFFRVYDNFMPFPPKTWGEFKWFPRNFLNMMDYPLGMFFPIIPSILLVIGIYSIRTDKEKFSILIFPTLLTLLASGLCLYPLIERFWLFLTPILIILLALGYESCSLYLSSLKSKYALLAILLISPITQSSYFILAPQKFYKHKKSYERESLKYINNHIKDGDCVYNYWNNKPGCNLYSEMYKFKYDAIMGNDNRKTSKNLEEYNYKLKLDFQQFKRSKRVWVVFNNQFLTDIGDKIDSPNWYYRGILKPNENLINQLKTVGKPVIKRIQGDVSIYLFELKILP